MLNGENRGYDSSEISELEPPVPAWEPRRSTFNRGTVLTITALAASLIKPAMGAGIEDIGSSTVGTLENVPSSWTTLPATGDELESVFPDEDELDFSDLVAFLPDSRPDGRVRGTVGIGEAFEPDWEF